MSYKDFPNLRGLSESGAYGTIPEDVYLRKIEQTNLYEDPMQVENYYRSTLVDFRPDQPYLASDEVRDPADRGGGTHGVEIMNLRYGGARSTEDPDLPDGTFTDWEFMDRDPRGIAVDPDMRQHYEQQVSRGAFIKMSNDEDFSVPETGINPTKMVENIVGGRDEFRRRWLNFEESKDAWHNGGTAMSRRQGGDIAKFTMDGTIIDLAESAVKNRSDAVTRLSNDPTVGYRFTVPDQRVKIGRYGVQRYRQGIKELDIVNNRNSTFTTGVKPVMIDGVLMNRMLANLIIDAQGLRDTKQAVAQGATYNDSSVNQQRNKKLHADDIYKILSIGGVQSQEATAHMQLNGTAINSGKVKRSDNRSTTGQVQVNHEITKSMEQATKLGKSREVKDLREKISNSAEDNGIYNEDTTRKAINRYRTENQTRSSESTRHIEESFEVKSYSGIKPSRDNRVMSKIRGEAFGSNSAATLDRLGRRRGHKFKETDDNEEDQSRGDLDFGTFDKAFKEGSKSHMGRGIQKNMVSDVGDLAQVQEVDAVNPVKFLW